MNGCSDQRFFVNLAAVYGSCPQLKHLRRTRAGNAEAPLQPKQSRIQLSLREEKISLSSNNKLEAFFWQSLTEKCRALLFPAASA